MLQLILGGAGSGKSTRLTEYIAADVAAGTRAWLIIPEQQANLSERTMLPKLPPSAGLTFTIAGFTRLAREVAARYGGVLSPLPCGIDSLIMWQNLRDLSGLLSEYGTVSPRSDTKLTELLLGTVEELRSSAITPAMLEKAAEQLPADDALRPKLYDLALLYAAYDHGVAEALDGHDGDEVARLANMLDEHDYFAGGHVYIDSFTDFTAEEYVVLRHILKQAERVTLTLCYDEQRTLDPSFDCISDTLRRITLLCEREHITVEYETLTENHRAVTDELRLLERHLWNFALKKEDIPTPTARDSITLLRCSNIYAEAEATALHILDCLHHGVPYGDMAVIVRDSETYRGVLDAVFERYGIPFYFSEKTALSEKPLSRLLLSALRAVSHGWQAQDILAILRTGLCPVSAYEIDLFEQYVSTWGINGAAFAAEVWTRNPDGYNERMSARGAEILRVANRVREIIMTPLLRLYTATAKGDKLPSLCASLYELMQAFGIAERCAALAEREL
ncbi:MAG: exodeoxyribonuclease V subunit gamma, partial [Clostridia bacterium]|nr:exodeoxyribonuclease V subunit gamma [Clostridia bacterium]